VFGNAEFNLPGGDARDLTVGIVPDPTDPAKRRLFASSPGAGGQLQLDNVHLSSAGHHLFADRLIDVMVGRGFWRRR
jgi:lysophospholipase L1-like esterase